VYPSLKRGREVNEGRVGGGRYVNRSRLAIGSGGGVMMTTINEVVRRDNYIENEKMLVTPRRQSVCERWRERVKDVRGWMLKVYTRQMELQRAGTENSNPPPPLYLLAQ
jgi:hypothetical protein